jgi:hypothetical protein
MSPVRASLAVSHPIDRRTKLGAIVRRHSIGRDGIIRGPHRTVNIARIAIVSVKQV